MSWSFQKNSQNGPNKWDNKFSKCSSDSQSPINIITQITKKCNILCNLKMKYKNSKCNYIIKNNIPFLLYDKGSYILYKKVKYNLYQIALHTPSLHLIDNQRYCLELNLYHKSIDGSIIIISVMVEGNDRFSSSQDFFQEFVPSLTKTENKITNIPIDKRWNINQTIPLDKAFYLYKGSLPYPPCNENVTWIILQTAVNIERKHLKKIKSLILSKNNARPIQKLNNRNIYFNINDDNSKSIGQVYVQCKKVQVKDIDNIEDEPPQEELLLDKPIKKTKEKVKKLVKKFDSYKVIISILIIIVFVFLGIGFSFLIPVRDIELIIIDFYKKIYILKS